MVEAKKKGNPWIKRVLIAGLVLLVAGGIIIWYIFTEKFTDTSKSEAAFTVSALPFLNEFIQNDSLANKKYAEQIVTVRGRITETESADTTINIKMIDAATSAYIIFAFQQQHLAEAKQLKAGDSVAIKGSCSGGTHSDILETEFVTFKRCAITK